MTPWVEMHIALLRDIEQTLSAEQRANVATLFEQCDFMLVERTKALHVIARMVGAGAGCDLVHELPQHVADLVREREKR